jgi:nucleotide-binding universal stress UspA family protein
MNPLIEKKSDFQLRAVIFATDFSICSQNAGLYGVLVAKHFSAKLLVTHAFTLSQAAMEVEIDQSMVSRQREDLLLMLSQKSKALSSGSLQATPVLLDGAPEDVVPALADENVPSMLMLGTHGGSWVDRELIGSVAEKILRSACCPCFTVGPQVRPLTSATLPFHRILCATDFTPSGARAMAYAVSLAQAVGAEIDALNVVHQDAVNDQDTLKKIKGQFHKALEGIAPDNLEQLCHLTTFVEVGDVHQQILRHVHDRSINLLVLGIERTSHLGFWMRSSGCFALIVDAECPVLTITG